MAHSSCLLSGRQIKALKDPAAGNGVKRLGMALSSVHELASRSAYPADVAWHPLQLGHWVLPKTWRQQGPEHQLSAGAQAHTWSYSAHTQLSSWLEESHGYIALGLRWSRYHQKNDPRPKRPAEQWVCEPWGDLRLLFKKISTEAKISLYKRSHQI